MAIKHSGLKFLTAFLKAHFKEGLIKIKEAKGGMVITGMNWLRVVERWFNGSSHIGTDGSHSAVNALIRHVTVKEVETHKGKLEEVQAQEMERFQEERCE